MSHSRQTEHYALPLYDGTDIINPLTDFNNANEAIDEAVYNANQRAASSETIAQTAAATVTQYDDRIVAVEALADEANKTADNVEAMMAEEFDPLKEGGYSIGDIVIYNGKLYSFINPHTGAWDAGDVKVQTIGDAMEVTIEQAKADIAAEVAEAMAEISQQTEKVSATQSMIAPAFDEDKEDGYEAGEFVTYADKLYMFNEHHDGAWTGVDVEDVKCVNLIKNVEAKADAITAKVTNKVVLSEEQFITTSVNDTPNNKLKDIIGQVATLFNEKDDDVVDIIVDGIDYTGYTFVCEWSMYDVVVRNKTMNIVHVLLNPNTTTTDEYRRSIEYLNNPRSCFLNLIVNTVPNQTAGTPSSVRYNLGDAANTDTITIAFHYLYRV